jgi:hypothetical protein
MPPKPQRSITERVVSGGKSIADEANSYMLRRRARRRPYVRVGYPGGHTASFDPDSPRGRGLIKAGNAIIDAHERSE